MCSESDTESAKSGSKRDGSPSSKHGRTSKQHKFKTQSFKGLQTCAHCSRLFVGFYKHGLRCKRCGMNVHEKCQEDLEKTCVQSPSSSESEVCDKPERIKSAKATYSFSGSPALGKLTRAVNQHVFINRKHLTTSCAYCKQALSGGKKRGLRCKRCRMCVHERCVADLQEACIEVIIGNHNFVKKTYSTIRHCDYCKHIVTGMINSALKCSECGTKIHEKCQEKIGVLCRPSYPYSRKTSLKARKSSGAKEIARNESTPLLYRPEKTEEASTSDYSKLFLLMPETLPSDKSPTHSFSLPTSPMYTSKEKTEASVESVEKRTRIMKAYAFKVQDDKDTLDMLQNQAEDLEQQSQLSEEKSEEVNKERCLKEKYMMIAIIITIIILTVILIAIIVVFVQKSKHSNEPPNS